MARLVLCCCTVGLGMPLHGLAPAVWGQFCWGKRKTGPNQQVVAATQFLLAIVAPPLLPAALGAGRPTALDCGQLCAAPREHATTLELLLLRVLVAHPHLDGWFSGVLNGDNDYFQWEFGTPTPQW